MKLTEKATSATERVCVYGAPKSGKSLLVGKLAEHYNLIWFDNENGWGVLRQLPQAWQERINIISIPDSKTYPIAAETWMKVIKGSRTEICMEHSKVSCALCKRDNKPVEVVELNATPANTVVVFDSLTQLSQSFIAHITKAQPDDYKMEFDDWGNLKILIEKFLSQVQVAGYNIVCITHEEETEFEDKKKKIVPVAGSSKSSRNTAKYFDHVVYVEVKNKKHVAGSGTDYGMSIVSGSRTGVRLEADAEPTLLKLFTSWRNGFNVERISSGIDTGNSVVNTAGMESTAVAAKIGAAVDTRTPGQIALDRLKSQQQSQAGSK